MEAIAANGLEEITKVAEEMDRAEVADQIGQTIHTGFQGDGRTISAGEGYQSSEFRGVRRNLSRQTERDKARKAACLTAQKRGKEG